MAGPEIENQGDLEITQYTSVVSGYQLDSVTTFDVRDTTEQWVTERLAAYCQRKGLEMVGPVLIEWHCRGDVRTRPITTPVPETP